MIPILYSKDEKEFKTNGIGRLNCVSCVVTEERNGVYECEFEIDMDDPIYSKIEQGTIIACTHDDRKDLQPFEIYGRREPINGVVKFYAHHISYKLGKIILEPFTAGSIAQVFAQMNLRSVNENPFTFWTDKETTANFALKVPQTVKATLGGTSGSVLDTFGGGEFEFDKYTVKLYQNRGQDTGVDIRYGKNLTRFTREADGSGTYNAVAPYWYQDEGNILVTLPEKIVVSDSIEELSGALTSHTREPLTDENGEPLIAVYQAEIEAVPLDLSDQFDTQPTEAQLRAKAQSLINGTDTQEIDETIEVDFVALWQTEEYKNVAPLQRLSLCDRANITHPKLGLYKYKAQIIKTEYDAIKDRYVRMTLGKPRKTYADTIRANVTETILKQVPDMNTLQAALDYATDLIKGGKGGYKVEITDADGHPTETLYMDSPDIETAVNILRINRNGIAFSNHGYDPEYFVSAWTIDGSFNANFINTGELSANIVKTGIIRDKTGTNYWNLDTGEISISYSQEEGAEVTQADLSRVENNARTWAGDAETNAKQYANSTFTTPTVVDGKINASAEGLRTEFSGTYAAKNDVYSEIVEMFYKSTSPTQIFGGEWTREYPTPEAGFYIWHKFLYYKLSGGTPDESTPARLTGDAGTNGENGMDARYLYITSSGSTSTAKETPITATLTACVGRGTDIDEDPRGTLYSYGWFIKPDGEEETFYRRGKSIELSIDKTLCENVAALRFALIPDDTFFALQDETGTALTTHTGEALEV